MGDQGNNKRRNNDGEEEGKKRILERRDGDVRQRP